MTTTITPSGGAGALFTQQGVGASPGYAALDLRRPDTGRLQEGVVNASDFMVVQRGAGANMSVDIGMPAGGFAYVQGDTINGQSLYCVPVHSATINEPLAPADLTNPRVDQVILEVLDNALDASGGNLARTRVLTGTPQAATNLTSRAGAQTLPGSALLLADILVGAAAGSVDNTVIRDRRKFARGAYDRIIRTTNASAGNDYGATQSTSGTALVVDSTNLAPRIECSGAPMRVSLRCNISSTAASARVVPEIRSDGALVDAIYPALRAAALTNVESFEVVTWDFVPSAGSHVIALYLWVEPTSTGSLWARSTSPLEFTIEELIRQNTANNTTTSG